MYVFIFLVKVTDRPPFGKYVFMVSVPDFFPPRLLEWESISDSAFS